MITDHYLFFCGVFAVLFVGGFFVLTGLEMRKIANEAAERRRAPGAGAKLPERS